jgi:hypothetical protein
MFSRFHGTAAVLGDSRRAVAFDDCANAATLTNPWNVVASTNCGTAAVLGIRRIAFDDSANVATLTNPWNVVASRIAGTAAVLGDSADCFR